MNTIRSKAFIVLLFVFMAQSAFGQSYLAFQDEWARIVGTSKFSLGPLRFFPMFQLKNVGFINNVYFDDKPKSDYTGTLSPEVTAYLPLGRSLILNFRENPEYVYFLHEKQQRTFTNSYSLGLKYLLFHRIVLSGEYLSTDRQQQVSAELARPARETGTGYAFGLFYETPRKTSIGVTGAVRKNFYKDIQTADGTIALSQALNREERSAFMEFYYQIFRDGYFFTKAGYSEYRFEQTSLDRDSRSYQIYSGIRFPLLGRIRGTLSLGYKYFVPRSGDKKGFSGIVGDTSLESRIGRIGIRLAYKRDNNFSYFENAFLFIEDRYSAGLSFYLTKFLRFDYNYEWGISDYPVVESLPAGESPAAEMTRKDKQMSHSGGVVFRVIRNIGLGVMFNSARWTSSLPGFDRNRSSISAYLTYQF